ncbi:uncharacterized protein [Diadema setosum]|uniref:uncharacterized protein n=1 Tax=Diadema setosum TaxID=31175 RepID=UPI003B3A2191
MTSILIEFVKRRGVDCFKVPSLHSTRLLLATATVIISRNDVEQFHRAILILKYVIKMIKTKFEKEFQPLRCAKILVELKRRIVMRKIKDCADSAEAYAVINEYFPSMEHDALPRRRALRDQARQKLLMAVDARLKDDFNVVDDGMQETVERLGKYVVDVNKQLPSTKIDELSACNETLGLDDDSPQDISGGTLDGFYGKLVLFCLTGRPTEEQLLSLLQEVWNGVPEKPTNITDRTQDQGEEDEEEEKDAEEEEQRNQVERLNDVLGRAIDAQVSNGVFPKEMGAKECLEHNIVLEGCSTEEDADDTYMECLDEQISEPEEDRDGKSEAVSEELPKYAASDGDYDLIPDRTLEEGGEDEEDDKEKGEERDQDTEVERPNNVLGGKIDARANNGVFAEEMKGDKIERQESFEEDIIIIEEDSDETYMECVDEQISEPGDDGEGGSEGSSEELPNYALYEGSHTGDTSGDEEWVPMDSDTDSNYNFTSSSRVSRRRSGRFRRDYGKGRSTRSSTSPTKSVHSPKAILTGGHKFSPCYVRLQKLELHGHDTVNLGTGVDGEVSFNQPLPNSGLFR